MKRIGLFGGTFNPIHLGHLWAANSVQKKFGLDHIVFIPSAVPPHKSPDGIEPAEARLEMLRLALDKNPYFSASDVELNRKGPSYTIDTVRYFQSNADPGTHFFMIIGIDAFIEMNTWKSFQNLFNHVPMIVLSRPDDAAGATESFFQRVQHFLMTHISTDYVFSSDKSHFSHPHQEVVYLFEHTMLDISATMIRKKIICGETIDDLVPQPVDFYILEKGLYR